MFSLDIHCHFFPEAFLEEARRPDNPFQAAIRPGPEGEERLICAGNFDHPLTPDFYDADQMLADMDRRLVAMSAISAAPPTLSYWADAPAAVRIATRMNDSIAERVRAHPSRFLGLATVPLQDVESSVKEARRAIETLGLHGFMIGSNVNGVNLDHPDLFPFFETVAALGVPLFIHPYIPAGSERMQDYYLHNLIGMVAETGLAIASTIFGAIYERLPDLKVCFAHGGGVFPYIHGRSMHGYVVRPVECGSAIPHPPDDYLTALYFDSITHDASALRYLTTVVGADQIVIGSDYPFDMGPAEPVREVLENPYLTEHDKAQIVGLNAARLFGLDLPAEG